MALTKYPISPVLVPTTAATAAVTNVALGQGDVGDTLRDILIELRILNSFMGQAFNLSDDPNDYRINPDNSF